jgi:hypothetical protein
MKAKLITRCECVRYLEVPEPPSETFKVALAPKRWTVDELTDPDKAITMEVRDFTLSRYDYDSYGARVAVYLEAL